MKVFTYVRVSSKGQAEGDGPERQRLASATFCEHHNLVNISSFYDAFTGTSEDRPGFNDLLQAIDHNLANAEGDQRVGAVVVERMDRLARDLMASEILLRELRNRGIKLFAVDQGTLDDMASDDIDPTRILIRQIMGALAQWEKSCLVKKLRVARERAAKEGRVGGNKPFGAKEGEQDALRQLFEWTRQGFNTADVADMMNARGYASRTGKPWSKHTIQGIVARLGRVNSPTDGAKAARKELANLLG